MPAIPRTLSRAPLPAPPLLQADLDAERVRMRKRVVVGVAAGTAALLLLLLLLLLLFPLLMGSGGSSHESGGGGGGMADAGGGRSDAGDSGSGSADPVEVAGEGGSDQTSSSAIPEGAPDGTPAAGGGSREQERRRPPVERGLETVTLSALPEAQQEQSREASASAGFSDVDERLRDAGAHSGDVQISLAWNNRNDLDLHVTTPSGERIYYDHKRSGCGGELDVDMNVQGRQSDRPVENIFWPYGSAPRGKYVVTVHHYENHGGRDPTAYQVVVNVDGVTRRFEGTIRRKEFQIVHTFER